MKSGLVYCTRNHPRACYAKSGRAWCLTRGYHAVGKEETDD